MNPIMAKQIGTMAYDGRPDEFAPFVMVWEAF